MRRRTGEGRDADVLAIQKDITCCKIVCPRNKLLPICLPNNAASERLLLFLHELQQEGARVARRRTRRRLRTDNPRSPRAAPFSPQAARLRETSGCAWSKCFPCVGRPNIQPRSSRIDFAPGAAGQEAAKPRMHHRGRFALHSGVRRCVPGDHVCRRSTPHTSMQCLRVLGNVGLGGCGGLQLPPRRCGAHRGTRGLRRPRHSWRGGRGNAENTLLPTLPLSSHTALASTRGFRQHGSFFSAALLWQAASPEQPGSHWRPLSGHNHSNHTCTTQAIKQRL